jgi:capsular polysaccharide export protein
MDWPLLLKGIGSVMCLYPRFTSEARTVARASIEDRTEMVAGRMEACFEGACREKIREVGLPPLSVVSSNAEKSDLRRDNTVPGDLNQPGARGMLTSGNESVPASPALRVVPAQPAVRRWQADHIIGTYPRPRSFLFLQGSATRFFERLGRALAHRDHTVHRVNFNGGDRALWRLPGAIDFRGRLHAWPDFLDQLLREKAVSDIILFGDYRPLHRAAIRVAAKRSVRVHVVEEGYLRPDWITFEEGGAYGYSTLPRDPSWYFEQAASLPPWQDAPEVPGSFRRRAIEDLIYAISSAVNVWRFPNYTDDRPYPRPVEYAGWLRRLALMKRQERRAEASIAQLAKICDPVFFFPLQLDDDYQVRVHSPFGAMHLAIEYVISSFARHAPSTARLVVRLHPLDNGLVDWAKLILHAAADVGVANRVIVIEGGSLGAVLACSRGVVTVNSNVGSLALRLGLPVIALGRAIYDLPGLTFQGDLGEFWRALKTPDLALFDAFRRVLAARCLIPGSFFNERGLKLAVDAAISRLEASYALPARGYAENPAASIADAEVREDYVAAWVHTARTSLASAYPSRWAVRGS